nr:hypothetical protein [Denitrovibrio acetiphilus]
MAELACEHGADAIGVVAYKKSKRYVAPEQAKAIKNAINGRCPLVVVSVSKEDCEPYASFADYVQADDANTSETQILSGSERPDGIFRYFLYDASRGAGLRSDYPDWIEEYSDRLILAGGLDSDNVIDVIEKYKPFGVDVSSGVETDGEKDIEKIKVFINNAKTN